MPQLLLGPLLRYVSRDAATIWVETDRPCTVGILDVTTPTFSVWGHHYALVIVRGLAPASAIAYTVTLDGEQRWPLLDSPYPPSVIRTLGGSGPTRILFGSCRAAGPHEPPFDRLPEDDDRGIGVDALRSHGLRMLARSVDEWPDLIMMLGDQVYAVARHRCVHRCTPRRWHRRSTDRDRGGFRGVHDAVPRVVDTRRRTMDALGASVGDDL